MIRIILDATIHRDKPAPVLPGCHPLRIIYADEAYPTYPPGQTPPPAEHLRPLSHRSKYTTTGDELLCIDIEHLPDDLWHGNPPDRDVETSLDHLGYIADVMHAERPGLRLGFFGVMPTQLPGALDYRRPDVLHATTRKLYGRDGATGRFEPEGLADKVDVTFPPLYPHSEFDPAVWRERATLTVSDARRYHKQVYPIICPRVHVGPHRGRVLGADLWRVMLDTCMTLADGVGIWDGWATDGSGYLPWDDGAEWWQIVQEVSG